MRILQSLIVCLLLVAGVCGCVKIETGYTPEEAEQSSLKAADRIRREWAHEMGQASPKQMAGMLVDYYFKVTNSYIRFGYETIDNWAENERKLGREVTDAEIQRMIDSWLATEKPVLSAYSDNIQLSYDLIVESEYFERDFLDHLVSLGDQYRTTMEIAFQPRGTLKDYEYRLEQAKYDTEEAGEKAREALARL